MHLVKCHLSHACNVEEFLVFVLGEVEGVPEVLHHRVLLGLLRVAADHVQDGVEDLHVQLLQLKMM